MASTVCYYPPPYGYFVYFGSSVHVASLAFDFYVVTQSQSSGERSTRSAPSSHVHSHRRTSANTVIKITSVGGGSDNASLHSASSMASMASVGSNVSGRSNRSGVLMRSRSNSSPNTLVEVRQHSTMLGSKSVVYQLAQVYLLA